MNRYSVRRSRSMQTGGTGSRPMARLRAILLAALAAALAVSLAFGLPAITARTNTHSFIVNRMATECKAAFDVSQTLSLTASTNSYEKLARIRSYVYGMDMLNNVDGVMGGARGQLLDENEFVVLYSLIEAYNNQLITGMNTSSYVTDLQNRLAALYDKVQALQ